MAVKLSRSGRPMVAAGGEEGSGLRTARPELAWAPAHGDEIAGRYVVRHRVGRGAMGVVYRVHDRTLDRDVALKLMLPRSDDSGGVQRTLLAFRRDDQADDMTAGGERP